MNKTLAISALLTIAPLTASAGEAENILSFNLLMPIQGNLSMSLMFGMRGVFWDLVALNGPALGVK